MARLEDITVGSSIKGLVANETVTVIAATMRGSNVMDVAYKDSKGNLGQTLLYRESEGDLEIEEMSLPWSFDADGATRPSV